MNFAEGTVTVYLVGLVSLYTPQATDPPTLGKREVIVPLATSETTKHAGITLRPHHAFLVIRGLEKDTDCSGIGTLAGTDCTVGPLSGKWIKLPASSTPFALSDRYTLRVPKITNQCSKVRLDRTYLTDDSKYAARLSLTNGALDSCTSQHALIPFLTLEKSTGELTVSGKCEADPTKTCSTTVKLKDGANVFVVNSPDEPRKSPVDEREHFYWYYTMFTPSSGGPCTGFPKVGWVANACPATIPHAHRAGFLSQTGPSCTPHEFP